MEPRHRARLAAVLAALALGTLLLAGCVTTSTSDQSSSASTSTATTTDQSASTSTGAATTDSAATNGQGETLYTPTYKLNGSETAVIKTTKGTIKVRFFEKDAPIAVANFIELAQKGFYNGIKFHRYEPGFVIQGGDPNTKQATQAQVAAAAGSGQFGSGGPGYAIKDEYANNPNKHVDGALAMARTSMPDTGGSQFYFALTALPSLDNQYTVFGQTTSGLDVVHALRAGDEIESITLDNASK